jgi:hypothetical protein
MLHVFICDAKVTLKYRVLVYISVFHSNSYACVCKGLMAVSLPTNEIQNSTS